MLPPALVVFLHPTPLTCALSTLAVFAAFEVYSWVSYVAITASSLPRITPGGPLRFNRDFKDYAYIYINRVITVPFLFHALAFADSLTTADASFLTIVAPVPLLFVLYDLVYAPLHAAAHAFEPLYKAVHKHHHRQVAPFRGADDAVNTHPVEYCIGMWIHLLVAAAVVYCGVPLHPTALVIFIGLGSLLAAANHTRVEVAIPYFFNSNEHDTHHRFSRYNYAQYTCVWDRLVGTFRAWTSPPSVAPRAGPPPAALAHGRLRDAPRTCVVTGGNGLVGARLVTMLLERGANRVTSIDLAPWRGAPDARLTSVVADICDEAGLAALFAGADAVFHVAALVGPGFPREAYARVNVEGTRSVVSAARAAGVRALVVTSSPTTRLDGADERGSVIDDRAPVAPAQQLQEYSRTKAAGEELALAASSRAMRVCAIAPHQVYGPEDRLFLPALLRAAAARRLRVFGEGSNLISFTHVDNAAHAHILAAAALLRGDAGVDGEFFVVTDTGAVYLWDAIDAAVVRCGLPSLESRLHVPIPLLYVAAYFAAAWSSLCCLRKPLALAPFAVRMLTMERWFDVRKLQERLAYKPLVSFANAWVASVDSIRERLSNEGVIFGTIPPTRGKSQKLRSASAAAGRRKN